MILYHGSDIIIAAPEIFTEYRAMDFGGGFYTTTNKEQARDFCQRVIDRKSRLDKNFNGRKFISIYEVNEEKIKSALKVKEFITPDEDWFDFVEANRYARYSGDTHDVVIGPVANDTIYRVFAAYEENIITREQAIERLKVSKLYNQFVFATDTTITFLKYSGFEEVE